MILQDKMNEERRNSKPIRMTALRILCLAFTIFSLFYLLTDINITMTVYQRNFFISKLIVVKPVAEETDANLYTFSNYQYFNRTRRPTDNVVCFLVPSFTGDLHVGFNPYPRLCERVLELDRQFDDNYTTDVIIFHTGYPYREDILPILQKSRRQVEFVNIDQIFYRFSSGFQPHIRDPNWTMKGKWNYHHMCYFWFKQVFTLKILRRYRYMMRLDDDSQISGHWPNVFQIMKTSQALYMANQREVDFEYILRGMALVRNLTADYIKEKKIIPRNPAMVADFFNKTWEIPNYWNNFEIVDLEFIHRKDVQDYMDVIDQSQGIFLYRWGDAALRYITLALFTNETEILHRQKLGLAYCHGLSCN